MIEDLITHQGHAIVLLGNFNPSIFQPYWFANEELIRKKEANDAELQIAHRDVTVFKTDWFNIIITRDKFTIGSNQEAYYSPLRDLVLGTFKILNQTPVHAIGINREFHFRSPSKKKIIFDELIAPSSYWNKILGKHVVESFMISEKRQGAFPGYRKLKIEPSNKVKNGIYFDVNDHFENTVNRQDKKSNYEIITLEEKWESPLENSFKLIEKVWTFK